MTLELHNLKKKKKTKKKFYKWKCRKKLREEQVPFTVSKVMQANINKLARTRVITPQIDIRYSRSYGLSYQKIMLINLFIIEITTTKTSRENFK